MKIEKLRLNHPRSVIPGDTFRLEIWHPDERKEIKEWKIDYTSTLVGCWCIMMNGIMGVILLDEENFNKESLGI